VEDFDEDTCDFRTIFDDDKDKFVSPKLTFFFDEID
jgi:hypothetical protein